MFSDASVKKTFMPVEKNRFFYVNFPETILQIHSSLLIRPDVKYFITTNFL